MSFCVWTCHLCHTKVIKYCYYPSEVTNLVSIHMKFVALVSGCWNTYEIQASPLSRFWIEKIVQGIPSFSQPQLVGSLRQTSLRGMDDHNIGEDVKATPIWKHNCAELVLVRQTDWTAPARKRKLLSCLLCHRNGTVRHVKD